VFKNDPGWENHPSLQNVWSRLKYHRWKKHEIALVHSQQISSHPTGMACTKKHRPWWIGWLGQGSTVKQEMLQVCQQCWEVRHQAGSA
jgi:hypothetical protein